MTTFLVLVRALHYASGMMLAGAATFRWLVLASSNTRPLEVVTEKFRGRLQAIFLGCIPALALSELLLLWITTTQMSGASLFDSLDPNTLSAVLFQTHFGSVCLTRGAMILLLLFALALCVKTQAPSPRKFVCESLAGLLAIALYLSNAWAGHAAAGVGLALPIHLLVDAMHLLATCVWPTGLLFFALFLGEVRRSRLELLPADLGPIVERFSAVSFFAVWVLSLTGIGNACFLIGNFHALFCTTYGQILDVKLLLFAVILGLAAWNRWQLLPAFASTRDVPNGQRILRHLRRFVWAEFGLAVAIIIVVSILGVTPPAR